MKDAKKGKVNAKSHTRGVAFVEFEEHEHALVALRVLNNNPGINGSCHLITYSLSPFVLLYKLDQIIIYFFTFCRDFWP